MIQINKINYDKSKEILDDSEFIFTTKCWIDFLIAEKYGNPIILKILLNNKICYFVGLIFKKMLIKICGSPFEGWSSQYMGFIHLNLFSEEEKKQIINNTVKYLFKKEKCFYVQICDWHIDCAFAKKYNFKYEFSETPFLDVSATDEDVYSHFKNDARRCCRVFGERGATFEIVPPTHEFASDYYSQLIDVFAKQNLKPFYSFEKIDHMMSHFSKYSSYILCENVFEPETKKSIATGIFLGYKQRFYFFGLASYRSYQYYTPSEIIIWNAIKHWKNNGCTEFDMIGTRKYKEKFNPSIIELPVLYFSKIPGIHLAKNFFKKKVARSRKMRKQ